MTPSSDPVESPYTPCPEPLPYSPFPPPGPVVSLTPATPAFPGASLIPKTPSSELLVPSSFGIVSPLHGVVLVTTALSRCVGGPSAAFDLAPSRQAFLAELKELPGCGRASNWPLLTNSTAT